MNLGKTGDFYKTNPSQLHRASPPAPTTRKNNWRTDETNHVYVGVKRAAGNRLTYEKRSCLTPENKSFLQNESPRLRRALMDWLNAWGCRHLSRKNHPVASKSILDWYRSNSAALFSDKTPLWQLENREIKATANAYGSLRDKIAARRSRYGNESEVRIGPTAASKILFAIRPNALMPWDDAMRRSFSCDGSPESYAKYLTVMRSIALRIADLCRSKGFQIDDLPGRIGRAGSTAVELLNEYFWVKTRKPPIRLPSSDTLTQWASLG